MLAEILAALAEMPPTPLAGELARSLGWDAPRLAEALDAMERMGLVDRWPDRERPGATRVMLSTRALDRLWLRLSERGDAWEPRRPDFRRDTSRVASAYQGA